MRTLSLDLRERILSSYDKEEGTREEIANRYRVSLGMVKKLLQQRRRTGEIGARHHRSGRKPIILAAHKRQMRTLLGQKPDLTLKELREIEGLTTAAGIWMTVAAGVAVGLGQIGLAFLSVILTWIVLSVLGRNRASPRGLRSRDENLDPSATVAVASRLAEDERSTFRELADGGVRSANRSPHAAQAEDHLKALFHRHGEWDRR